MTEIPLDSPSRVRVQGSGWVGGSEDPQLWELEGGGGLSPTPLTRGVRESVIAVSNWGGELGIPVPSPMSQGSGIRSGVPIPVFDSLVSGVDMQPGVGYGGRDSGRARGQG